MIEDNIEQLVNELAQQTGNDPEDADIQYECGPAGNAICISFGREEYECYASDDDAVDAAKQDIKNTIDELGGVLEAGFNWDNLGGIESYVDEDDAKEVVREVLESNIEDMDEDGIAELQAQYDADDPDEIVEKQLDKIDSYVEYIIANFGEEELNFLVKGGNVRFDIDRLVETVVNSDGPANSLARYDGNEIFLDGCGYYCYRTN